jgi:hypothetical protein
MLAAGPAPFETAAVRGLLRVTVIDITIRSNADMLQAYYGDGQMGNRKRLVNGIPMLPNLYL